MSGADAQLTNDATQVVLMREGTRTVLSMQNNYQGPPQDFAMVVPVPVVLQKENVKTLTGTSSTTSTAHGAAPGRVLGAGPVPAGPCAPAASRAPRRGVTPGTRGAAARHGPPARRCKIEAQFAWASTTSSC